MKTLGSIIATVALALSALVAVPSAAQAAYPGTVATTCNYFAPGVVKRKRSYNVAYSVRAAGNARPSGKVIFRVWQVKKHRVKKIRVFVNGYTGPAYRRKSLGSFKQKGRYFSQLEFVPNRGSVYKHCASGLRTFRVKR